MNREEIIRMAMEAGFESHDAMINHTKELQRFAELIASVEREACAKVCEEPGWNAANWCAKAIRARGQ